MNLDELQSVQARERQSSDLQHLRSSFYREAGEYIRELTDERARVVDSVEDPFSSPEVRRLTDDIETAEGTVEAIYERRVGKVVKKASIAAAGMPVEEEGLTSEEAALFEDLVARIEDNREAVLSVLDGEGPAVSCSVEEADANSPGREAPSAGGPGDGSMPDESGAKAAGESDPAGVNAADLMGEEPPGDPGKPSDAEAVEPSEGPPVEPVGDSGAPPEAAGTGAAPADPTPEPGGPGRGSDDPGVGGRGDAGGADVGPGEGERETETDDGRGIPGIPRTTVRITADVGEVVGADDRDYDLGAGEVVTLPDPNAEVLVEKDAAERLQ